jgi:hypothetical protein
VPAGASAAFDIVAVFNPEGCNDGGTLKVYQFPQLHVSALGEDRVSVGRSWPSTTPSIPPAATPLIR